MIEVKEEDKKPKQIQSSAKKARSSMEGGIVVSVLLFALDYLLFRKIFDFPIGKILVYIISFLVFICLMVSISSYFDWKEAKKLEKLEEDANREEKEFSEIDPSKRALRAEKLFKMNQKELMRYYDMNLAQTKFLSTLGIMMIILGVFIVVASFILYVSWESDQILLFVGSISGIIVDFVGAVFIKMYTGNIEAAVKFHAKFAEGNNLLLANSIANKIENEQLRESTLSEIAKDIILSKDR